jgi:hypothetical protein
MKIRTFKSGIAIFEDAKSAARLKIEVDRDGYLHIGEKVYRVKNGVADVGALPEGDYGVSVTASDKIYRAFERLIVSDTGAVSVDSTDLHQAVIKLAERQDDIYERLTIVENKTKTHERKINGPSLFGELK